MNNVEYKEILKKNFDYWQITEEEYLKKRNEMDKKSSFNDVIWSLLNQKLLEYEFKKDYSEVRNMILAQAKFLEKEKKSPLFQYIELVLYDICLEYELIQQLKQFKDIEIPLEELDPTIEPPKAKIFFYLKIVEKIQKYKKDYHNIDLKRIYSLNSMYKPISFEEYKDIIDEMINENFDVELHNQYFTEKFE